MAITGSPVLSYTPGYVLYKSDFSFHIKEDLGRGVTAMIEVINKDNKIIDSNTTTFDSLGKIRTGSTSVTSRGFKIDSNKYKTDEELINYVVSEYSFRVTIK